MQIYIVIFNSQSLFRLNMNNIFKKLILLLIQTEKTCRGASFKYKLSCFIIKFQKLNIQRAFFWMKIKIKVK
jgi:hypothetical protein